MPMLMVAAAVPFRKRRRDGAAPPAKVISESLGKCVQPMRSHMTGPPRRAGFLKWDWLCRYPAPDELPAGTRRHANRREPLMRPALRRFVQGACHATTVIPSAARDL